MTEASHKRSIVVWDVPPSIVCGETFTIRLGIKCESLCRPQDWSLEVHDHEGRRLGGVVARETAWPGTEALHGAEIELKAPAAEGLHCWKILAAAAGVHPPRPDGSDASPDEESREGAAVHESAAATFNVRAVPEADCRLTVIAIERETQSPVRGAKVVAHPYRALTNEQGIAELALPQGRYRIFVSGRDCFPLRVDGTLAADTTIRVELEQEPGPSDAELWT